MKAPCRWRRANQDKASVHPYFCSKLGHAIGEHLFQKDATESEKKRLEKRGQYTSLRREVCICYFSAAADGILSDPRDGHGG